LAVDLSAVTIRAERAGEAAAVAQLGARAFGQELIATLIDALKASPDYIPGLSFVAEYEGQLAGHVMYTRSLLDAASKLVDVLVLSPVSVVPELQGQGIGSLMIRQTLELMRARPEPLVFLEGNPAYYGRFGFEAAEQFGFRKPSLRIPDAAFQVLKLPTYEDWMTGTLVYSRVFWDLDCVGLR